MSAAAVTEVPPPPPAKGKGKKKLIIIIAIAAVVLAGAGGAAVFLLKKKAAAESAESEGEVTTDDSAPTKSGTRPDPKAVPIFVPMDPFTVNLADREAERYAQIGITLEIDDTKTGDQIKNYMPAIRNNILMAIADRTAAELMGREGKARLADKIKRETARALGYDVGEDEAAGGAQADTPAKAGTTAAKKKMKQQAAAPTLPIKAVHFSNFIIQ